MEDGPEDAPERPEIWKQPAGNEGTDNTDDDVADEAEASPCHHQAGEPTGDGANDQKDDECLRIHAFAPGCGRRGQRPALPVLPNPANLNPYDRQPAAG